MIRMNFFDAAVAFNTYRILQNFVLACKLQFDSAKKKSTKKVAFDPKTPFV